MPLHILDIWCIGAAVQVVYVIHHTCHRPPVTWCMSYIIHVMQHVVRVASALCPHLYSYYISVLSFSCDPPKGNRIRNVYVWGVFQVDMSSVLPIDVICRAYCRKMCGAYCLCCASRLLLPHVCYYMSATTCLLLHVCIYRLCTSSVATTRASCLLSLATTRASCLLSVATTRASRQPHLLQTWHYHIPLENITLLHTSCKHDTITNLLQTWHYLTPLENITLLHTSSSRHTHVVAHKDILAHKCVVAHKYILVYMWHVRDRRTCVQ